LSTIREECCIIFDLSQLDEKTNMPEQQLQENLEKLRAEIEQVADSDTEAKARLNALINEIEASIDPEQESEDNNLAQSIKDAVSHFETEHPRATAILNDIMVTLSNMGI
jgi:FtsZ-binding cell division protein ZapB